MSTENDLNAGTVLRMVLLRASYNYGNYLTLASVREAPSGSRSGDSGGPVFIYRGMHALVAIMVSHLSNYTLAVALAPNYPWIKETVERLSAP
jgi:hypothetical protein